MLGSTWGLHRHDGPMALALSIAMLILSLVVPSELSTFIMISFLFWAAMSGLTSMAILCNGPDYVDQRTVFLTPVSCFFSCC